MECDWVSSWVSGLANRGTSQFLDEWVADHEQGGKAAAFQLTKSIKEYYQARLPELRSDLKVVVHVYANLKGLGRTYSDAGLIQHPAEIMEFVRGFNMAHALDDFIDAGDGKECADEKVRGRQLVAENPGTALTVN